MAARRSRAAADDDPFGLLDGTQPLDDDDDYATGASPDEDDTEDDDEGTEDDGGSDAAASEDDDDSGSDAEGDDSTPQARSESTDEADDEAEDDRAGEEPSAPAGQSNDDAADEDPRAALAQERERRVKAQQAMAKMRRENAQLRAAQAPNPATYGQPPAPPGAVPPAVPGAPGVPGQAPAQTPPPGYEITVSDDGQSVYVPREAIATDAEQVAQRVAAEQVAQFQAQQTQAMENVFVSQNPETNTEIIDEAREVDQFVALATETAAMQGQLVIDERNPDGIGALLDAMDAAGITDQVRTLYPRVGEHFDSFFRAWASRDPFAKLQVYNALGSAAPAPSTPAGGGRSKPKRTKREGRVVERVVDNPPSHARRGSGRGDETGDDQREFGKLYKTFLTSPGKLKDAQLDRLNELGVKLGKDGFDSED